MGTVYQAVHREMNRVVALKLIHAGNRDEAAIRVRFEREVQSLVRIEQHPNIVPVYGIGTWQGFPYLTMRFVPGGTLARHMERVRADLPAAIRLVAKVARAVHRLHEVGVLHRDLKPPNILLDSGDEPLVADFGLAKWLDDDSDVTASGAP
ncbi:MAG TPA: serine/threonine-protein kinase, partial [Gemmataceae bacterium]|nr:serine/threonine-protein kinase [Gemmataceae bacterium]